MTAPAVATPATPNARKVREIADRLSLRPPQREALERLDRVLGAHGLPPKGADEATLELWRERVREALPEAANFSDFERDFVSLAFALATGVGKTRLMGAMIAYLHLVHGVNNFFVLAPNLTIYNKLIGDFHPQNPKYVLRGLPEFTVDPPIIVTGDDYDKAQTGGARLFGRVVVNVFNISKINSEVRGGRDPRIRKPHENLEMGQSYFEYLQHLPDLVMLMDESHRYRASAGVRAINELAPRLGLELTATPYVETSKGPVAFKNIVQDYTLARAIRDGFVKVPAVVTRQDFNAAQYEQAELEKIKLEDGVRLHESVKSELAAYALNAGERRVKPFMLVIARDTTHAAELLALMESADFFEGSYAGKVIQVDHTSEDLMIERLLKVEDEHEPTEIVVHVNMLKEGWDVTNLYTIVPLRAANARVLIEQSIGRGLRLPFGKRVGRRGAALDPLDRLNIVAHDRFQDIVDEANREESTLRLMEHVLLDSEGRERVREVVNVQPVYLREVGAVPSESGAAENDPTQNSPTQTPEHPLHAHLHTEAGQQVAAATLRVIERLSRDPQRVPTSAALLTAENQARLAEEVEREVARERVSVPLQPVLLGQEEAPAAPPVAELATYFAEQVVRGTIDIPRISVTPVSEVVTQFEPFALDLSAVQLQAGSKTLVIHSLGDNSQERLGGETTRGITGESAHDRAVALILDNSEVSYEDNAATVHDLAGQLVAHLEAHGLDERDIREVLSVHRRVLSRLIFAQMRSRSRQSEAVYESKVTQGFVRLLGGELSYAGGVRLDNIHQRPPSGVRIESCVYGGLSRCCTDYVKFHSDPERRLAALLETQAHKWLRPAQKQFGIWYTAGDGLSGQYQPDFVAETGTELLLLEVKAQNELTDPVVLAKARAAREWCAVASSYAAGHGGKPWRYALIGEEAIHAGATLGGLIGG